MTAVLIANRGEIAIRIARAVRELGWRAVGVYASDDSESLHTRVMDETYLLEGAGPAAYLNQDALLAVAYKSGAHYLHPGYGFLSESESFAAQCEAQGVNFVGPASHVLAELGDKVQARVVAHDAGVPVIPGTSEPTTLDQAQTFLEQHGAVMIKAMAGGGGRGMREVQEVDELPAAYEACFSEAKQAFGIGDLYVEKLLPIVRHIEVQIIGDGSGEVCHLWERDCSIQRRHQKIIEIAPAPNLSAPLRDSILEAALRLTSAVKFRGLCTVEFLVDPDNNFWFMESNPRLQVEHTITEEVTGIDLVLAQLRIATGATLSELGLLQPPICKGVAIQARVNLETISSQGDPVPSAGTLTAYDTPGGPNVRVDGYGYTGYQTSLRYDPLLAKVIARGASFEVAVANTLLALREFNVSGVATNIPLLIGLISHPAFNAGIFTTGFIATHLTELIEAASKQGSLVPALGLREDGAKAFAGDIRMPLDGELAIYAPMSGVVIKYLTQKGALLAKGDPVLVQEAMKMEYIVGAPCDGKLLAVVAREGESVIEGQLLAIVEPIASSDSEPQNCETTGAEPRHQDDGWIREVDEIQRRRKLAQAMGGEPRLARQREQGKLNARERIVALVDEGSFLEIGVLAGFGSDDDNVRKRNIVPSNFVAGTAKLDGRKVVLGVDDFTLRAGAGDAAIHEKQIFAEAYAREMRLPVVRLLDGASGGGSVTLALEKGFHYVPVNPGWDAVVENLSLVPVIAACVGPTVGLGAARLVMSHFAVMVEKVGQVFTAGPPVVQGATRETLTKEELGGVAVHATSGIVERVVASETEAFTLIRRFLGYLPRSVFHLPPVIEGREPSAEEDALIYAIPRNERQPYGVKPILDAIFDTDSVLLYAQYGGAMVTALARLNGHPVGVIATDPMRGATMTVEGAQAVTRLVDLCETFHLPIVSLTDQAGVSIGSEPERRGTLRHGARAISAIYQARVPQAELILRRVFGVGGAGAVNRHRANRSWAWPSGSWGSLPQQGGIEAAFRAEIAQSDDPTATIERIAKQLKDIASPFHTAEKFGVQDIIDPRESRALLCDWVEDAYAILPEYLGKTSMGCRP